MSDERKESRIDLENLQSETKELTADDAKKVKGGTGGIINAGSSPSGKWREEYVIKGNNSNDKGK